MTWLSELKRGERLARYYAALEAGHLPYFRTAGSILGPSVEMEGRSRLMLGSPNYLGLADHPLVIEAAKSAVDTYGSTLTGSRILNGTTKLHEELEEELADWYGAESVLVFTTGYQTNIGTISALVGPADTVVADSYAHASMLDGAKLSGAKLRGFRHNRMDLFEDSMSRAHRDGGRILVILDGLYSMEGDLAPLDEMLPICQRYGAVVMLDEAHAAGILGIRGTGAAEVFGVESSIGIRMGAMSKALAGVGGYIAGSRTLTDHLRIHARAFFFTTVGVPAAIGASLAAVRIRRSAEGAELADRLRKNARFLRTGLEHLGFKLGPDARVQEKTTPIIPVLMGDDDLAMRWWRRLYEQGVFTGVAIHPGVPPDGAILRVCPMATHSQDQLDGALDVFQKVRREAP